MILAVWNFSVFVWVLTVMASLSSQERRLGTFRWSSCECLGLLLRYSSKEQWTTSKKNGNTWSVFAITGETGGQTVKTIPTYLPKFICKDINFTKHVLLFKQLECNQGYVILIQLSNTLIILKVLSYMSSLRILEDFEHYLPKCTLSCIQDTKSWKFLKRIHRIYVFFFHIKLTVNCFYNSSDLAQANGSAHI